MKKTIYLKSMFLLFALLAGVLSAHAQDYDYVCEQVNDLSEVAGGETVLLVDQSKGLALSNSGTYGLGGVEIAIGEDNVIENVPANIMWTIEKTSDNSFMFKNNGNNLWGSRTTPSVGVSNTPSDVTYEFMLESYGADGGKLCYDGNDGRVYFCWSSSDANLISISDNTSDRFTLYKITVKNYVKWKKVNFNDLDFDDEVVIVDLTTGLAMTNDKGTDKKPGTVAVELNADKDRIIGSEENNGLPANILWVVELDSKNPMQVKFHNGDDRLQYDDSELSVGQEKESVFTAIEHNCLKTVNMNTGDSNKPYYVGLKNSMMSKSWEVKVEKDGGGVDDDIKDSEIAIFKKVESPERVVTLELAEYYNYDVNKKDDYTLDERDFNEKVTITGAEKSDITWSSSNTAVATINAQGVITLIKRGTTVITASVEEEGNHDKASAKCTLIVDDSSTADLGTLAHPLTVAEAKQLAETGKVTIEGDIDVLTWEEGVHYYIKGKVSKVNSGMMAMFGDMDFGEMMGGSGGDMDLEDEMGDMDFDMDSMSEMGIDMSSMGFDMSSLFGPSDKVTYYISDDGTKDNQMKVINGCGTVKNSGSTAIEFNGKPDLSPGDCVVVCGPIVYTEDSSMFSGMMGGGDEEPKKSAKVDEMNYLAIYDPTLLIKEPEKEIYVNKTLDGSVTNPMAGNSLYEIDNYFDAFNDEVKIPDGAKVEAPTYKSSDEDIAKWDEDTKKIVGVNIGTAKITVKVKVILQEADDTADPKVEEKSYTMKRKFKLTVKTRDLLPAGYYDGEWVLTTDTDDLLEGTRLVLAGTRVKDGNETDYMMVDNSSMMGGGKSGSKIVFDDTDKNKIQSATVVSKGGLEIVLEKDENNANFWNLNVGIDEKDTPLYLYATASTSDEEDNGIMEMFSPSSGMKVGTKADAAKDAEEEDVVVSLKASISFSDNIATIKFDGISNEKNNTIMLTSAFDMDAMMEMFGGQGEGEGTGEGTGQGQEESTSTSDMGSFDMFMASFNTKKPGDETAEEGKEPKCFMPRIYRFVPFETFDIAIGTTEWRTIVTYKDVTVPDNVEAYIVKDVQPEETQSLAVLTRVNELASGEPYLLHTSQPGNYTMTLLTPYATDKLEAPEGNLLMKSNRQTAGTKEGSTVYVLANKSKGVGFYRWTGDELGAGRVYLPVGAAVAGAHEYCGFSVDDETSGIQSIDDTKTNAGPFYDLQGRRVDNPKKGVYIVNGKKVIVK